MLSDRFVPGQVDALIRLRAGERIYRSDVPPGLWARLGMDGAYDCIFDDGRNEPYLKGLHRAMLYPLCIVERDAALARCAELEARAKRAEAALLGLAQKMWAGSVEHTIALAYAEADRRIAEAKGGSE